MQEDRPSRIVATDAAIAEIERLKERHGPLMFFVSGGCCDGSSPICLPEGELRLGGNDRLLGEVDGARVYVDREQDERWRAPSFVLDIAPGGGSSMSLEETDGLHFVLASPITCAPD